MSEEQKKENTAPSESKESKPKDINIHQVETVGSESELPKK